MSGQREINLQITTLGIIKIIIVLLVLAFLFLIKDLLIILFVSFVLAAALNPIVNKWEENKRMPRSLSLILIYLVLFIILAVIVSSFLPTIIAELKGLIQNLSPYFQQVSNLPAEQATAADNNLQKVIDSLNTFLTGNNGLFSNIISLFGGLGSFLFILIITFYLVVDKKSMKDFFYNFTPLEYQGYLIPFLKRAQEKIGQWFKGQIILSFIIGALCYIGLLLIIGVKFSLVLALLAAVTEIIPYLGPFLGAIPAILIALFQSPMKALLVAVLYLLIQQLENAIITPRIMGKAVGLNPIIIICSLWIGGKLGGILGMIVAVPVVGALSILLKDFWDLKKKKLNIKDLGTET